MNRQFRLSYILFAFLSLIHPAFRCPSQVFSFSPNRVVLKQGRRDSNDEHQTQVENASGQSQVCIEKEGGNAAHQGARWLAYEQMYVSQMVGSMELRWQGGRSSHACFRTLDAMHSPMGVIIVVGGEGGDDQSALKDTEMGS